MGVAAVFRSHPSPHPSSCSVPVRSVRLTCIPGAFSVPTRMTPPLPRAARRCARLPSIAVFLLAAATSFAGPGWGSTSPAHSSSVACMVAAISAFSRSAIAAARVSKAVADVMRHLPRVPMRRFRNGRAAGRRVPTCCHTAACMAARLACRCRVCARLVLLSRSSLVFACSAHAAVAVCRAACPSRVTLHMPA